MEPKAIGLRAVCLGIGYLFGSFLTAEPVARVTTGKGVAEIGSGNPGMANVMEHIGKGAGAVVLAGDALKTALAVLLCGLEIGPHIGSAAMLYAGLGAVLGHNFPAWRKFHGGKGVAVTCVWLMLYLPVGGTLACMGGGAAVLLTGYLPLGAVLIPALAVPAAFWQRGAEGGIVLLLALAIMLSRHKNGLRRIVSGREPRYFKGRRGTGG